MRPLPAPLLASLAALLCAAVPVVATPLGAGYGPPNEATVAPEPDRPPATGVRAGDPELHRMGSHPLLPRPELGSLAPGRGPVSWRPSPSRRGLAPAGSIDDMTQLVSQDSIENNVARLEAFGTRQADRTEARLAAAWLASRFRSFGADSVYTHTWFGGFAPNVVAIRRGSTRPQEIYLIGGHFDSISSSRTLAPGADDNASGTSLVLECARVLCQFRFQSTVQFVAFSGEEFGLFGSDAYAAMLSKAGANLLGVVNVDMIGYLAPRDRRDLDIVSNVQSEWLHELVVQVAAAYTPDLPVVRGAYPQYATSDQASFWNYGFYAISFFEDTKSSSPYLHTPDDVSGISFNDPYLAARSTQVAVALLATLAEPVDVPVLVQDFSARVSGGEVELEWVLAGDAIRAVQVQRAPAPEGPWVSRTSSPLSPAPRMGFVDSEVPDGPLWYRLSLEAADGEIRYAGPLAVEVDGPRGTTLAVRDPGRGSPVEIRFALGNTADLNLGVYDTRGRRVRLLDSGLRAAGTTLRTWDRRDETGTSIARGVYFVLLDTGAVRVTRKLVLMHD